MKLIYLKNEREKANFSEIWAFPPRKLEVFDDDDVASKFV